jgi:hypothetical protein
VNPIRLDESGHIIADESMSAELREKIAAYNALASAEGSEVENDISDDEADSYTEDSIDTGELEEDVVIEHDTEEVPVAEEDLNSLNNLFE